MSAVEANLLRALMPRKSQLLERGAELHHRLEQIRKASWARACRTKQVVGMTSTFAAVNRDFVHRLRPKVLPARVTLACRAMP